MKRTIIILIGIVLLFSVISVTAFADVPATSGYCGETGVNSGKDVSWEFDSASATITISGKGAIGQYTWAPISSQIKNVVIVNGVTQIGTYAFKGMETLESVKIPSSVTSIFKGAFEECSALKNVELNEGLENCGMEVFYGCSSLEKITLPASLKMIGLEMLANCQNLTDVTILFDAKHNNIQTGQWWLERSNNAVINLVAKDTPGFKFKKWSAQYLQEYIADTNKANTTMTYYDANDYIVAEYASLTTTTTATKKTTTTKSKTTISVTTPSTTTKLNVNSPKTGVGQDMSTILALFVLSGATAVAAGVRIKANKNK